MVTEDVASARGRRRSRHEGGRDTQIKVRVNAAEKEKIAANAAAAGMTPNSYLALRGQDALAGGEGSVMSLPQMRAWVAELYALKRITRGSANNLNQLVKAAHVTGEAAEEIRHHAARLANTEQRISELLEAIGPELKPRS